MTRQQLQQAYFLVKRIEDLETQKREIEVTQILKAQSYSGMPHTGGVSSPTERMAMRLKDIDDEIDVFEQNARECLKEIMKFINSLEDVFLADIIRKRCVNMCSWKQIAEYFGDGYSADAVRKYYERKVPWK